MDMCRACVVLVPRTLWSVAARATRSPDE